MKRCTRATPANVSRSRSRWTRRQRAEQAERRERMVGRILYYAAHPEHDDEWEDRDDYDDDGPCQTCGDTGFVSNCPDDLCHGEDGCMHGDNEVCPECHGDSL